MIRKYSCEEREKESERERESVGERKAFLKIVITLSSLNLIPCIWLFVNSFRSNLHKDADFLWVKKLSTDSSMQLHAFKWELHGWNEKKIRIKLTVLGNL